MYGDHMNYKNIFKRETKVIALVVICLTLVVIGASYALFMKVNHNQNNQVVTAGSLEITYDYKNLIAVDANGEAACLLPQSDSEARTGGCKVTLSIANKGTLPMEYSLLIYDDTASLPSGGELVSHSLIRHSLNKGYTVANKTETVTTGKALSELATKDSKKVLETSVIESGETIEFSLNIWISDSATTDIIDKYVYLKLDVTGTVFENETALQTLTKDMGTSGLNEVATSLATFADTENTESLKEYRYVGANPNNYVYFNCSDISNTSSCEVWRILGIDNNQNGENTESRLKLVREHSVDISKAWDTNNGNTFGNSSIYNYLNTEYYNGLSDFTKSLIGSATYKLGGADALELNSTYMHAHESSASESVFANVGLMSVGDYALGSSMKEEDLLNTIASRNTTNWLYTGKSEWFINRDTAGHVYSLNADGSISLEAPTNTEKLIRPVVYLDSNIKIIGGNGTSETPYIITK